MISISWFSLSDKNVPEKQDNLYVSWTEPVLFKPRSLASSTDHLLSYLHNILGKLMGRRLGAGSVSKEPTSFLGRHVCTNMCVHALVVLGEPTRSPTPKHAFSSSF